MKGDWYELTPDERIERLALAVYQLERILDANNIEYPVEHIPGYTLLVVNRATDQLSVDRQYGIYGSVLAKQASSCSEQESKHEQT